MDMLISLNVYASFEVGNCRHWSYIDVFQHVKYNVVGDRGTDI